MHFTTHIDMIHKRPDRATLPTVADLTPAMIAAGEVETLGGGVSCHWNPRELAVTVFLAMAQNV